MYWNWHSKTDSEKGINFEDINVRVLQTVAKKNSHTLSQTCTVHSFLVLDFMNHPNLWDFIAFEDKNFQDFSQTDYSLENSIAKPDLLM